MPPTRPPAAAPLRHAGDVTIAVLARRGIDTMFTLNGGHVWPFYDVARHLGVRVVDTRHEQTAVFAAEGYAKLTRTPCSPPVHRGPRCHERRQRHHLRSGERHSAGGPRRPGAAGSLGVGSLQEFDHAPLLVPVTKMARTLTDPTQAAPLAEELVTTALTAHRGPGVRRLSPRWVRAADTPLPLPRPIAVVAPDGDAVTRAAVHRRCPASGLHRRE